MLIGAHTIIYTTNAEGDRAFFRDILNLTNVDVGEGWLIFSLPPSEVAMHPSDKNDVHELYLMCDDVDAFVAEMATNNIPCEPVEDQGWGLLTHLTLPGGGRLGVYQPRHARPQPVATEKPPQPEAAAMETPPMPEAVATEAPPAKRTRRAVRKPAKRPAKKMAKRLVKKPAKRTAKAAPKKKGRRR